MAFSNFSNLTFPSGGFGNRSKSSKGSFDVRSVVQLMCFPLIVAVGLIGNTLICVAVRRRSRLRIIDCFILNLATTDLATCMISIPFDFIEILVEKWPFGSYLCKIVYPLQTILISVSVYTLLCMSLERRRAIIRPFKPKVKGWRVLLMICLLWVFSVVLMGPYIVILDVDQIDGTNYCMEHWPEKHHAKIFTLSVFLFLYLLPLVAITTNYLTISSKLWKDIARIRRAIGEVPPTHGKKQLVKARAQRNMRIVKIFVLVVIVFAFCMVPNHIMWIWHDFGSGSSYAHFGTILVFCNILMYSNSAINPFIFVFLHSRYCKDIMARLPCSACENKLCFWKGEKAKQHFRKYQRKRHLNLAKKGALRRQKAESTKRSAHFPLSQRNPWSEMLLQAESLNVGLGGNRQQNKTWRRFCHMEMVKEQTADIQEARPLQRQRKPRVNFGGERIIHIDEFNNVELESAI